MIRFFLISFSALFSVFGNYEDDSINTTSSAIVKKNPSNNEQYSVPNKIHTDHPNPVNVTPNEEEKQENIGIPWDIANEMTQNELIENRDRKTREVIDRINEENTPDSNDKLKDITNHSTVAKTDNPINIIDKSDATSIAINSPSGIQHKHSDEIREVTVNPDSSVSSFNSSNIDNQEIDIIEKDIKDNKVEEVINYVKFCNHATLILIDTNTGKRTKQVIVLGDSISFNKLNITLKKTCLALFRNKELANNQKSLFSVGVAFIEVLEDKEDKRIIDQGYIDSNHIKIKHYHFYNTIIMLDQCH